MLILVGFFAIPFRASQYSARLVSETGQLLAEGQRVFYAMLTTMANRRNLYITISPITVSPLSTNIQPMANYPASGI
jgi:hypothetical protein